MVRKRKLFDYETVILGIEIFAAFLLLYNYTSLKLHWVIILSPLIAITFGRFVFLLLGLIVGLFFLLIQVFVISYRKHPWITPFYKYFKPLTLKDILNKEKDENTKP